jgi:regulator of PEP synthase PpsR (kinase-PPPase family)
MIDPDVLQKVRVVRQKHSRLKPSYSDFKNVFAEVEYVWGLTRKHRTWKVINTTNKSIEETAWEIIYHVFGEGRGEFH